MGSFCWNLWNCGLIGHLGIREKHGAGAEWQGYRQRSSAVECVRGGDAQDGSQVRPDLEGEDEEGRVDRGRIRHFGVRPTVLPATVLVVAMCSLHDRTAMEDQAASEAEPRGLLASGSPPPSSDPNENHHGVKIDIHLAGDVKSSAHQAGVGSLECEIYDSL